MGHDIADADLERMLALTEHPAALREIVAISRAKLGFYPRHKPRSMEYPWILGNAPQPLRGARVLDVGAGLNPLPFALADRGASVFTLDNHRVVRTLEGREDWNEWGFLDYAVLDPRIVSIHRAYESWTAPAPFDLIYSVSVIEHVPAAVRAAWIASFAAQTRPGGTLLLTVDVIAGSDDLWNYSEGLLVEERAAHGDVRRLCEEVERSGFAIASFEVRRELPDSVVDAAFLRAVRAA
jgi:protein-L-isoaspartate O-methyltransferase